jgi:hypothetical protein
MSVTSPLNSLTGVGQFSMSVNAHRRSVSFPCHPHGRTRPATRTGVGEHTRVGEGTAGKKEGPVPGTEESNRIASPPPAETKVRAGAVPPSSGCPEHQATGAVPRPADNTGSASRHLAELTEETRHAHTPRRQRRSADVFFQHPRLIASTIPAGAPHRVFAGIQPLAFVCNELFLDVGVCILRSAYSLGDLPRTQHRNIHTRQAPEYYSLV